MTLLDRLPEIFAIMARAIVWKTRRLRDVEIRIGGDGSDLGGDSGISIGSFGSSVGKGSIERRRDSFDVAVASGSSTMVWDRLGTLSPPYLLNLFLLTLRPGSSDSSFDSALSPPPDTFSLLSYLYCIWPCNVLKFIRDPPKYLLDSGMLFNKEGKPWSDVFDREDILIKTRVRLAQHVFANSSDSYPAGSPPTSRDEPRHRVLGRRRRARGSKEVGKGPS